MKCTVLEETGINFFLRSFTDCRVENVLKVDKIKGDRAFGMEWGVEKRPTHSSKASDPSSYRHALVVGILANNEGSSQWATPYEI